MRVGIITNTNQFVPVKPIIKNEVNDKLKVIENDDLFKIDNKVLENDSKDEERILIVKKIKLETNFYNMFRNSFKLFLSNKKNRESKFTIIETLNDIKITYTEKLKLISDFIKNIMKEKINFTTYKIDNLKDINELFKCFGLNEDKCNEKPNCSFNESGNCILLLPKENLLNGDDNSINYYLRLSDELIRFINIRKYIFTPRTFLSFENINYNLTNEEIILLEEVLLNKYFEDLIAIEFNKYVTNQQIYETTNPVEHLPIKKIFNINADKTNSNVCIYEPETPLKLIGWKELNNLPFSRIEHYKQSAFCTFELVLNLINENLKQKNKKEVDIITLKKELYQEIINIKNSENEAILFDTFKASSNIKYKKETSKVLNNDSQLETHISSANYFITEIDMYILLKKYKINAVLITNKTNIHLPISNENYFSFINDEKPVYVIVCNGMYTTVSKHFPDKAIGSRYGYPRYGLLYVNNSKLIEQKYIKDFIDNVGRIKSINEIFDKFKVINDKKKESQKLKDRERQKKHRIKKLKKIKIPKKKTVKPVGGAKKMKRMYKLP